MNTDNEKLNEISEKIIGAAFKVANTLGGGFLEKVYENALVHELRKAGLFVDQQKPVKVYYDGVIVGDYFSDICVERLIIVELKAAGGIEDIHKVRGLWTTEPLGYLEFLHLNMNAKMVLTDSGGLQEETTVLGVPCVTLRENTERPITCVEGTNVVAGNRKDRILAAARDVLDGKSSGRKIPEKWDGKAAERIVETIMNVELRNRGTV